MLLTAGEMLLAGRVMGCLVDVSPLVPPNPVNFLFPNWKLMEIQDFGMQVCLDPICPGDTNGGIAGVTIFNYGTADGVTDISAMYLCFACANSTGHACTPTYTLTYAGVWTVAGQPRPAWTWAPAAPFVIDFDPCNVFSNGCNCVIMTRIFIDIGPCPVPFHSVRLGPGYNPADPIPGGWNDNWGCTAPWGDKPSAADVPIIYAFKDVSTDTVVPGDTITYSIYYGRPGTPNVGPITIVDTLPPYTHYLTGTAAPVADPGWDPDPGPPVRMRWTIPGPLATAAGPTSVITFKVTVDWGNTETFEPGSGDTAAPEGAFLSNRAQTAFGGIACPTTAMVTPGVTSVVRRFLFWKLADNDMLYSPTPGQPPDEITYSIFLRNMSPTRTWWDVAVWDTVPAPLDPWCSGCGFDDPCLGWTMTPGGCAAGTPGRSVAGATTILTWRLDLPPAATMTLRWKAQVKGSTTAGASAINRASVLSLGRSGIVGGSGSSVFPKNFTHLAPIDLPTTYISYVAFGGENDTKGACPGYFLSFFPLNKKTQFEMRGLQYTGAGWAAAGGVSASIGCLIGDCLGGFPGNGGPCPVGALTGGGIAGCKIERIPASYDPVGWHGVCPAYPANFVYKLTSNSPVVWQLLSHLTDDNQDSHTYAPATTITFTGFQHYFWKRSNPVAGAGLGDSLALINTGADAFGSYVPTLATTVHLFRFDYTTLQWDYQRSYELGPESAAYDIGTPAADDAPWMTASSDAELIVNHGQNIASTLPCCCVQCADNHAAFFPTRQTGNVTSIPGQPATFYGIAQGYPDDVKVIVGNIGAVLASYEVWRYLPDNPVQVGLIPSQINGTTGTWSQVTATTVPAGLAAVANPVIYSTDGSAFNANSTALFKVELRSGGPIQVLGGVRLYQNYAGGAVFHAADGQQTGTEFWFHDAFTPLDSCNNGPETYALDIFCPKTGMAMRAESEDGYTATYTTTGPDQVVAFTALTNPVRKRNYRMTLTNPALGRVVAQYIQCRVTEKGYTAPFVQSGVHYIITAPPVVFTGLPFWLTVTVIEAGVTKTDYCGTSSFTATDPAAKLEGSPMDGYNFIWTSTIACSAAPDENGVRIFVNVILNRLGLQTIIATDTTDGSITGIVAVMVVGADIRLTKTPPLAVSASGDTVSFRICWSNFSSASAFTFVVTDAVPMGSTFVPEAGTAAFNCGNTAGVAPVTAYSTATSVTPPAFTDGNPIGGTHWLRWTVPQIGVNTTGCLCYRVTVN